MTRIWMWKFLMCLLHHRAWRFTSVMRVGIWPETWRVGERIFVDLRFAVFPCFFFDGKKAVLWFFEIDFCWECWNVCFLQVLSMMVGIRMFGPQQFRGWVAKAQPMQTEVVGQLHAANTKCIENFSLLKPQNLMKQPAPWRSILSVNYFCVAFHVYPF